MASNFTPPSIPQSLANTLEEDIKLGIWQNELPGNRQLAEHYHLSRNSVLKALRILEVRKVLHPAQKGKRRKIIVNATQKNRKKDLKLLIVSGKYQYPTSEDKALINLLENAWVSLQGDIVHVQVEMSRISQPENTIKRWRKKHSPDAVLIYMGVRKWINALVDTHLPIYCMGGEIGDSMENISSYGYSIKKTLTDVLRVLRSKGHTRVLYLRGSGRKDLDKVLIGVYRTVFGDIYSDDELKAFTPSFAQDCPWQWRGYWKESLLRLDPTVVICNRFNDLLSLYGFCNSAKIEIPKNLSIVTFSNSEHAQWLWPRPIQLRYPDEKNLIHFRKWIKSDFQMRDNANISLVWVDGESLIDI